VSIVPAPLGGGPIATGLEELRRSWGLILLLGICLVILGCVALGCLPLFTAFTVIYYGVVLVVSGIIYAIESLMLRRWRGCIQGMLVALLDVVIGYFMLTYTWRAAMAMTLMLAIYFVVSGVFQIVTPLVVPYPYPVLSILVGVISLGLGVAIFQNWREDYWWIIGLFVGVEMLVRGFSLIGLGLAARRIPASGSAPAV
jgi:uncharacterized membrane protein HdeD (DUF308 family)